MGISPDIDRCQGLIAFSPDSSPFRMIGMGGRKVLHRGEIAAAMQIVQQVC